MTPLSLLAGRKVTAGEIQYHLWDKCMYIIIFIWGGISSDIQSEI